MNPTTYSKLDLGRIQLDRALALFLDERDFVSTITLAGAAEEVLGKCYAYTVAGHEETRKIALRNEADAVRAIAQRLFREELSENKQVVPTINKARDALKHWDDGQPVTLDFEEKAADMLERAIYNYRLCTDNYPARVGEFDAARRR